MTAESHLPVPSATTTTTPTTPKPQTATVDATTSTADLPLSSGRRHGPATLFRTEICQQFEEHGTCRYGLSCMFAHGADHLRTVEQNIADGITTKEGVFCFVRAQRKHQPVQAADSASSTAKKEGGGEDEEEVPAKGCGKNAAKNKKKREAAKRARQIATHTSSAMIREGSGGTRTPPYATDEFLSVSRSGYRHNPYSRPPTPPQETTPPSCPKSSPVQSMPELKATTPSPLVLWAARGMRTTAASSCESTSSSSSS